MKRNDNDALFIIGNGYEVTAGDPATAIRRNALVVRWNGNTEMSGSLTAAGGINVANTISVSASTEADGSRFVKIRPGTALIVPASGDISMGEFTAGPQP